MTNPDMVKNASPEKASKAREGLRDEAAAPKAERRAPEHRGGSQDGDQQFPPSDDPLDSNQLKPMINARQKPGLKRPPA